MIGIFAAEGPNGNWIPGDINEFYWGSAAFHNNSGDGQVLLREQIHKCGDQPHNKKEGTQYRSLPLEHEN